MILGGNLPETRASELKLYTNDEVMAVNQTGINPRQLYKQDSSMVWVSDVPNSKDKYVALFNLSTVAKKIGIDFKILGFKQRAVVRNLWEKTDKGLFKNRFEGQINAHGAVLVRVSPKI